MKLTEIKATAGQEYFIFGPKKAQVFTRGRIFSLPEAKAQELWKVISIPAEKMIGELKEYKV
jgi:hypothetical protein